MTKTSRIERLLAAKLIVVIRRSVRSEVAPVVDALALSGIGVLEITSNTPGWTAEIAAARQRYPEVMVGAGTIINAELAAEAIQAGAEFLVTPNVDEGVVRIAHEHQCPVAMGALTPTEVAQALRYGADIIKLFPACEMGLSYFKALRGPFADQHFFAVGHFPISEVPAWLEAGASGVGLAGRLTELPNHDPSIIQEAAREILPLLQNA